MRSNSSAQPPHLEREFVAREKDVRWVWFPYLILCLNPDQAKTRAFVLLNRDYRVLGHGRSKWMSGEEYLEYLLASSFQSKSLTPSRLEKIAQDVQRAEGDGPSTLSAFLYDDGTQPMRSAENWKAYADRLHRLAKYKIVVGDKY